MTPLSFVVDEVGALASEAIAEILRREGDDAWRHLVEGGWSTLGADEPLPLRDLQEVARASGRVLNAATLVPALVLTRWWRPEPGVDPAAGVTFAAATTDGQVLAPYFFDGVSCLDLSGRRLDLDPDRIDYFAESMPVASATSVDTPSSLTSAQLADVSAMFAAVMVGCADEAVSRAISWSQTREQFGQTISKFQAVRHHLADMHVSRELAWSAAVAAGHEPDAALAWAQTAGQRAMDAIELAIQVHGGVGFTAEVGLHHYLNHVIGMRQFLSRVAVGVSDPTGGDAR